MRTNGGNKHCIKFLGQRHFQPNNSRDWDDEENHVGGDVCNGNGDVNGCRINTFVRRSSY
uniref:Uncharacterized protein n=1 Tax=Bionectria ochroleuca TaxID=29856 RepID=A0A0B7KE31_BIOOC